MKRKIFLLFVAIVLVISREPHIHAVLSDFSSSLSEKENIYMNFIKDYKGAPWDVIEICNDARKIIQSESQLLQASGPVNIIGDIHGNLDAVKYCYNTFFKNLNNGYSILFLGDYVDRGHYNVDSIIFILKLKILFPDKVFLLRGNHEFLDINSQSDHSLYQECIANYGGKIGRNLFLELNKTFNSLSLAAVIDNKIFCTHGGIGPGLTLDKISSLPKPTYLISSTENKLIESLVWNDPNEEIEDFAPNVNRGGSCQFFGAKAVFDFLKRSNLSTIVRGHQFLQYGFDISFDFKLITLFSSPNHRGTFHNLGAIARYTEEGAIIIENFSFPRKTSNVQNAVASKV